MRLAKQCSDVLSRSTAFSFRILFSDTKPLESFVASFNPKPANDRNYMIYILCWPEGEAQNVAFVETIELPSTGEHRIENNHARRRSVAAPVDGSGSRAI
jgi:hypothetical protein